jgi:LysM repeat protein
MRYRHDRTISHTSTSGHQLNGPAHAIGPAERTVMPLAADLPVAQPPHAFVIAATTTWKSVTVQPGDSVWALAVAHRTTVEALVSKNDLPRGGSLIHPGQRIMVPGKPAATPTPKPAPKPAAKPAPAPAAATTYTVRAGDSLSGIAAKHRVSLAALVSANRITNPHLIFPGQRLQIPGTATTQPSAKPAPKPAPKPEAKPAPKPPVAPTTTTYTVQPGDSLSAIATRHGVTLAALIAANDIADPALIFPGEQISVPGNATVPAPVPNSENTFAGYTYPDAVVNAAKANREALAARAVPSQEQTKALIQKTATQHGVDPRLALAIGWLESGWNQRAVSVANAIGTMQVIPMSGEWASDLAGRKLDLLDTEDNITAGVVIIKALLRSAEDREQAIAGYYQGLHSVKTNGMYKDTKSYVANVLAIYDRM